MRVPPAVARRLGALGAQPGPSGGGGRPDRPDDRVERRHRRRAPHARRAPRLRGAHAAGGAGGRPRRDRPRPRNGPHRVLGRLGGAARHRPHDSIADRARDGPADPPRRSHAGPRHDRYAEGRGPRHARVPHRAPRRQHPLAPRLRAARLVRRTGRSAGAALRRHGDRRDPRARDARSAAAQRRSHARGGGHRAVRPVGSGHPRSRGAHVRGHAPSQPPAGGGAAVGVARRVLRDAPAATIAPT